MQHSTMAAIALPVGVHTVSSNQIQFTIGDPTDEGVTNINFADGDKIVLNDLRSPSCLITFLCLKLSWEPRVMGTRRINMDGWRGNSAMLGKDWILRGLLEEVWILWHRHGSIEQQHVQPHEIHKRHHYELRGWSWIGRWPLHARRLPWKEQTPETTQESTRSQASIPRHEEGS